MVRVATVPAVWRDEAVTDDEYARGVVSAETVRLLHGTTDAQVWAREFVRMYDDPDLDVWLDEELMTTWFANAIEVGRAAGIDKARRRACGCIPEGWSG